MKKLDKKFFLTCGIIIAIPVIIILFLVIIRACNGGASYSKYEQMMITRTKRYAKTHKMLPKRGKRTIIKLDNLLEDGFKSPEKTLKNSTCNGSVEIYNNSNDIIKGKMYTYTPYLECDEYKTEYIKDRLLKDVVTSDSGLYKIDHEYIFKGNKVNNYISLYGEMYRIIKMDEDGDLKVIKQKRQDSYNWDGKYNITKNAYLGINNYKDSNIIDKLSEDYKVDRNISKALKAIIIPHDICIGKRSEKDLSLNITTECSEKLENQVVTLPSITDYTMASYDPNCKQMKDLSCTNFNYFSKFIDTSWTIDSISEDTSKVFYIDSMGPELESASKYKKYNWVFYIDSEQLYQGGTGTEKDPYIVK